MEHALLFIILHIADIAGGLVGLNAVAGLEVKKKLSGRAREGRETEKTDSLSSPSPALSSYSVTTGVTFVILMLGLESDPLC